MFIQCKKCGQKFEGRRLPFGAKRKFKCSECGHNKYVHVGGQALNHGPIHKRIVPLPTFSPRGKSRMLDLGEDLLRDAQR